MNKWEGQPIVYKGALNVLYSFFDILSMILYTPNDNATLFRRLGA